MANNTSLKSKATTGIIWNAFDKFSVQGSQFIIGMILARLLLPSDYGIIGMLSIFMAISYTFVSSGLGQGLVQLKERTNLDFSTVFVFNLLISCLLYILLFLSAPYISDFYIEPKLTDVCRVLGLTLIINSFALVQRTRLTIDLNFKILAKVNLISSLISGGIAIYLAYIGYGIWSLIFRSIINDSLSVLLLLYFNRWKPSFVFSRESFNKLFGFGSKLLAASLYSTAFRNIYNVLIGKYYSSSSLGFYSQANAITDVTSGTITNIMQQVTFPLLASLQNDKSKMVSVYKRLIKMTAFFVFPATILLAVIADPFIRLILGEKWLGTIELIQLACFARLFYPLSTINLSFLNANGRSDLFLKTDLAKAPMTIIVLIITIPISVKAVVIGHIATSFIGYFFNTYYSGKLFGYGIWKQLKDIWLVILISTITALITYVCMFYINGLLLKLIFGCVFYGLLYWLISYLFKIEELREIKLLINTILKVKK